MLDKDVSIRPAQPDDNRAVKQFVDGIMRGEFPAQSKVYDYQDLDNITEHYGGEREVFLVAKKDGEVVGTVAIKQERDNSALLRRIFVRKDLRGHGVGTELLNKAMEFCFANHYTTVSFRGTDRMQSALHLCLRHGFRESEKTAVDNFKLIVMKKKIADEKGPQA